jgi:xanthine/CO dehydrogenase XdhC/CoxF family maturation factor
VTYGVTKEEAARFGLPCGGNLRLVQEPLQTRHGSTRCWRVPRGTNWWRGGWTSTPVW